MFKNSLVTFLSEHGTDWSLEKADAIGTELVRAHIMGGLWEMRRKLQTLIKKALADLIEEELASKFTRSSYYRNLWRAVMEVICTDASVQESAKRHKVRQEDIYYEYDHLTGIQCEEMYQKAQEGDWCFDPINPKEYSKLSLKLRPFAKTMAFKRLNFIATYDRGICLEDFIEDLWLEGCRILQLNWHLPSEKARLNLARRSIANEALDLMKYHIHESRQRLASIEVETEGPHKDFERLATTLSLDRSVSSSKTRHLEGWSLYQMLQNTNRQDDENKHAWEVIKTLGSGLSSKYQTFLKVISLDVVPPEFEAYVQEKYNKTLEEATLDKKRPAYWKNGRKPKHEEFIQEINYRKLGKLACGWLEIRPSDLQRHIGPRLQRLIKEQENDSSMAEHLYTKTFSLKHWGIM